MKICRNYLSKKFCHVVSGTYLRQRTFVEYPKKNFYIFIRIFSDTSIYVIETLQKIIIVIFFFSMIETSIPYDSGLWNIKVYKDVLHILDDMLVDFKIEYIKDVRNVFTMFWPMSSLAEFIGLPHTHFAKHYSFLVVKNQRCIKHFRLHNTPPDNTVLDEKLKNAIQNITYQNGASVFNFVSHFGSHYVRSFSVGAVLYQVSFELNSVNIYC